MSAIVYLITMRDDNSPAGVVLAVKSNFDAACELTRTLYMLEHFGEKFAECYVRNVYFSIGACMGAFCDYQIDSYTLEAEPTCDASGSPIIFITTVNNRTHRLFADMSKASAVRRQSDTNRFSVWIVDNLDREAELLEMARKGKVNAQV